MQSTNLKLTPELISQIIIKKLWQLSREELVAIMKLFGFQIKEYQHIDRKKVNSDKEDISCCFEIHHRTQFIVEVSSDNSNEIISFENEWHMDMGVCMPIANLGELMMIVLNLFVEKFRIRFEGPNYNEERDSEYSSMEEMQFLFEELKNELEKIADKVEADKYEVELQHMKVGQVMETAYGSMPMEKKVEIEILLMSVNEYHKTNFNTVYRENTINDIDCFDFRINPEEEKMCPILWEKFIETLVPVANIQL